MTRTCLAVLLWLVAAAPLLAKEYTASRFDSRVEVMQGGSLRVTETIVFTFTEGTFKQVFRTIPTRRTDGVEFVSASMDGTLFPQGDGPGSVRVRRKEGLRVEWSFTPVSGSAHTFELTYIVRGVVQQADGTELLEWAALPREHDYAIAASAVEVIVPAPPVGQPRIRAQRIEGETSVVAGETSVTARATDIRRNGSFVISIAFARGSVLDGPPAWQARQLAYRKTMPMWLAAGGSVLAGCLILLFALRQSDDRAPRQQRMEWTSLIPPEQIPPAMAGALISNGQPQFQHAMATIFSLADRGIVSIREEPKRTLGQRNFVIQRTRAGERLAPHEEAVLEIIFAKVSGAEASVPMGKARTYLTRRWSRFKQAINGELSNAGLTDPRRIAQRRRYMVTGIALMMAAGVAALPCILIIERFGAWPLLVPLALVLGGLASFVFMAAHTPLSDDGVRRASQWHAYKKHLKDPQGIETRWGSSGPAEARILPYAVSLGLAAAWSKFMKKGRAQAPAWFHAASQQDAGPAFAIFIASSGAGAHGGGGGASGGGAAGGGASGAS